MGLLPTNQRDQGMVAVGVVSVMIAAAFYTYVYAPKNAELSTVEERVVALEAANEKAKVEVARGRDTKELRAQTELYKQNLELMRQLVPTGNEVPALLEQVSTAARRVGLDIGAVVFFLYVYQPTAEELETKRARVESLAKANAQAKAEMAKGSANELRAQAKMYADNLDLMRQLVPTGNEVPALLEQVSTAARRVGLDIGSVEPQPVIPGDEFDTYRYKISIVGGYHEVGEFLTNVGSLTRIVAPVNLKLTPSTNAEALRTKSRANQSVLQSDFEMQTYVAKVNPASEPRYGACGVNKS